MSRKHAKLVASNNRSWSFWRNVAAIKRREAEAAEMQRMYDRILDTVKVPRHLIGRG